VDPLPLIRALVHRYANAYANVVGRLRRRTIRTRHIARHVHTTTTTTDSDESWGEGEVAYDIIQRHIIRTSDTVIDSAASREPRGVLHSSTVLCTRTRARPRLRNAVGFRPPDASATYARIRIPARLRRCATGPPRFRSFSCPRDRAAAAAGRAGAPLFCDAAGGPVNDGAVPRHRGSSHPFGHIRPPPHPPPSGSNVFAFHLR